MNYAIILAGGSGTRVGHDIPKQFIKINEVPIIVYTLVPFLHAEDIDRIIIACNKDYYSCMQNWLDEFGINNVYITLGGKTRLDSVLNGIEFIKSNFGIDKTDCCLAHDSVRPFVSEEIIKQNIVAAKKYNAATTVVNLTETIVESDGNFLFKSYPRENVFSDQSPQTFNIKFFLDNIAKIPIEVQSKITDLSEVFFYNHKRVSIIKGDYNNFKITYPVDLDITKYYIDSGKYDWGHINLIDKKVKIDLN